MINGPPVEELIGRHLRDVLPNIADTIEPFYCHVLETSVPALNFQFDMPNTTNLDEMHNYLASYYHDTAI